MVYNIEDLFYNKIINTFKTRDSSDRWILFNSVGGFRYKDKLPDDFSVLDHDVARQIKRMVIDGTLRNEDLYIDSFAPEILAQLSFNDPEFIKALPDHVFGTNKLCHPLVGKNLDTVIVEDREKKISFKESFLSRLEGVFEEKAQSLVLQYEEFEKLCNDTKDFIALVNERFDVAEKKAAKCEKSKDDLTEMFKQVKERTLNSGDKIVGQVSKSKNKEL